MSRRCSLLLSVVVGLVLIQAVPLAALPVLRTVGVWVAQTLASWAAGKAIDYGMAVSFTTQLEEEVSRLVAEITVLSGAQRRAREDQLALVREQLDILRRLALVEPDVEQLRVEQEALLDRVSALERRLANLEGEMEDLKDRVGQLEEALIAECLDLRGAPRRGLEGFYVRDTPSATLTDSRVSESMSISTRVFLDACSPDLRSRGLLIQVAIVARGADRERLLYATFKHLRQDPMDPYRLNHLARYEFYLEPSVHPIDGRVEEFFVPYADIPFPSRLESIALALVFTRDGASVHSIPDRVLQCTPGARASCRWRR